MAQQTAVPVPLNTEESRPCMHYWEIQPATGPVSPGICRTCGEGRKFNNYVEGASWGDSRLSNRSRGEAPKEITSVVADQSQGDDLEEE